MTEAESGKAFMAETPKKHSAFAQVVFRKSGEVMDLGGKALIGLSGLGHVLGDHDVRRLNWRWLGLVLLASGAAVVVGIYLQAKAEETIP